MSWDMFRPLPLVDNEGSAGGRPEASREPKAAEEGDNVVEGDVEDARGARVGRARESSGFGGAAMLAEGSKGSDWGGLSTGRCGCGGFVVVVESSVADGAAASGRSDNMAGGCTRRHASSCEMRGGKWRGRRSGYRQQGGNKMWFCPLGAQFERAMENGNDICISRFLRCCGNLNAG